MNIIHSAKLEDVTYYPKEDRFKTTYSMTLQSDETFEVVCTFESLGGDTKWLAKKIEFLSGKVSKNCANTVRNFLFESEDGIKEMMNRERETILNSHKNYEKISADSVNIVEKTDGRAWTIWKLNFFLMPEKKFCYAFLQERENGSIKKFRLVEKKKKPLNWDTGEWYAGWSYDLQRELHTKLKELTL